jgi:type I restriction enzyme S subunit
MSTWSVLPLSDVLVDARPGFACGEDSEHGVFQFRMNNVTIDGQLDFSKKRRVPRESRDLKTYLVKYGDVLFNATNSPELVGKSAFFAGNGEPSVFSNHFLRLRPRIEKLEGRFLARWLALQFQRRVFQGMCRQWVNQATVGRDSLLAMRLPVPPLADQRRIAEILDKADELRVKRRAALKQLTALRQVILLDQFGNPNTNERGWPVIPLLEACVGISDIDHKMPKSVEKGVPFISAKDLLDDGSLSFENVKNISEADFQRLSRKSKPERGDIIYSRIGVNLGKARLVDVNFDFLCSYSCCTIKPNLEIVDPKFLCCLLDSPFLLKQAHRGVRAIAVPDLGINEIKNFRVYLPPLPLQHDFARRIDALERLKVFHRTSLVNMDALFASLQHRAFRGEL